MNKLNFLLISLLQVFSYSATSHQQRQKTINDIFGKMEIQGVDTKSPLLYGYFFYDSDSLKLEKLKDVLVMENYKVARLEEYEPSDFILHVEKIESHSRASLFKREIEFDKLSNTFKIRSYDGWDVGNKNPLEPLTSTKVFKNFIESKSTKELFKVANILYDLDMNDKAIKAFEIVITRGFKLDTCYFKQGIAYMRIGETTTGIENLEKATKINPNFFKAYFNIAAFSYENKEYAKSITFYSRAAEIDGKNDKVFYGLAASQFVLNELDNAKKNCQKALKLNSENTYAKMLLERIQSVE